jgi:hypothetical protein
MPWSYSSDPSSSAKDEVRFLTGDTDVNKPWTLQDPEIQYAVNLYSDHPPVTGRNLLAAAKCAESILARLKQGIANRAVGDLHVTYLSELPIVQELVRTLNMRANLQLVPMTMGGASIADKAGQDADPDRVQPAFKVDGMNKLSDTNDPSVADILGP